MVGRKFTFSPVIQLGAHESKNTIVETPHEYESSFKIEGSGGKDEESKDLGQQYYDYLTKDVSVPCVMWLERDDKAEHPGDGDGNRGGRARLRRGEDSDYEGNTGAHCRP